MMSAQNVADARAKILTSKPIKVFMKQRFFAFPLALILALLFSAVALAQAGGTYSLAWNTLNNAGGTTFSTGGGYSLGATAAQLNTGSMSGGVYSLSGGFWQANNVPTSLTLVRFSIYAVKQHRARVVWETASEQRVAGFTIWRAGKRDGKYRRVNSTLPQTPGAIGGASYKWQDKKVKAGKIYFYKLQVLCTDGTTETSKTKKIKIK